MNKSVMKCCICNNENIGQFITINNKKYHLCCIEQLQQENKKYKEVIDKTREYIKNASYFDGSGMCANDLLAILGGKE